MGHDQPGVLLVVGGNDISGGVACAGRAETFPEGFHVLLPEFPLGDVRQAEFPVLVRLVDARQKTLSLFLFRQMEEELDDAGSVAVEVSLHIDDRTIAVVPDSLVAMQRVREPFAAKNLGMNADDQDFLVIGSVEDADPSASLQIARGAPEKIVFQFGGAGMLEAEHLAALRIDPGHHMPDGAVLARGVHGLKDQQDRMAVVGIEKLLLRAQLLDVFLQKLFVLMLRFVNDVYLRGPPLQIDLGAFGDAKVFCVYFHGRPFDGRAAPILIDSFGSLWR